MFIDNTNILPDGTPNHGCDPDQIEALALRLIRSDDQLALTCHRLGIESRPTPEFCRLHPEDVDLTARQVAVEMILGEQVAQIARTASKGPQRHTGTALGDRAAAGRAGDKYPTYTARELEEIENHDGGQAT